MNDDLQDDYKKPISNQEMVELAIKQHQQKQISDYKFPTEIVTLPSKGLLYPKDNPLSSGTVEMKYMTAKEEDILTTQSYIKDGTVLDRLFKSLIVGNGEGIAIKYSDLVVGDKNAVMIAARVLGYGKDYEVEILDQSTGNKPVSYTHLRAHEFYKNEFEYTLPHSNRIITFMSTTEKVEQNIKYQLSVAEKRNRKKRDNTTTSRTTRLKNTILSVDGDYDKKTISNFVDNELFAMDSKSLRAYMNEVVPDIDLTYEFESEQTGERREIMLPIGVTFFWPNT